MQNELTGKVKKITEELGLKDTTNLIVRYLGHKFRPLVKNNTEKLKGALKTITWLTNKFRRTQNITIQGRIINANAIITTPLRFQLHGMHLHSKDQKIISKIQKTINRYIKPCTDSRYRTLNDRGGGSLNINDIYISTRMYYLRQLYRNNGQHYRKISHYLGLARIELNYLTKTGE